MEKVWLDGYKVVQKLEKVYVSFLYNGGLLTDMPRYKRYGIGKVTKRTRGDGPLAVFVNFENAQVFRKICGGSGYNNVICRIRYTESADKGYWQKSGGGVSGEHWQGKACADEVELIEEVV